jgi:phosphoribosylformylglycinamidine synthase subunit PurQ / glutaminase
LYIRAQKTYVLFAILVLYLIMFISDDCIVLSGSFSYGDYLRCGAIARISPMMQSVIEFAGKGGKVLGVCNGFQILCESHFLPGVLLHNANQQFNGQITPQA